MPTNTRRVTKAWRIVEEEDGRYYTLFHGLPAGKRRSRLLPRGRWLQAELKTAYFSVDGPVYTTGFHVFMDEPDADRYLKRFQKKRNLIVIPCLISYWRPKKNRQYSNVYLADMMRIL